MDTERKASRQIAFLLGALAVMGAVLWLPAPDAIQTADGPLALSLEGKAALAVLALAVILWATEAIPFPVTGLLALVLLVATGVESLQTLCEWGFGNTIILFIIGVLVFSAAITQTDLIRRATVFVLHHLGYEPRTIILAFVVVGALISGWITDMAVAAMLFPIAASILKDAGAEPRHSNFGRGLMIACAWGPLIGGVATPAGCGPNPLTIGFLQDLAGLDFTFVDWMLIGYPAALLMAPVGWFILVKVYPPEPFDTAAAERDMERRRQELGPLDRREIVALVVFVLMVTLWALPGPIAELSGGRVDYLDIRFVAVACSALLFLPGIAVISWKKAEAGVGWGGIILVVTGLALGKAIHATGAAAWLAHVVFHRLGELHPVAIVFAVVLGVSLMKVVFSSNTVTGAIMVPLLIALAAQLGLDPGLVAIPAGITASLAFILVTSTPTNVIPYSSGYFSIADMVKAGLIMTVASSVCVTISICVVGRALGLVEW